MRHEYELEETMHSLFSLSRILHVPVEGLLEAIAPVVFDDNDLDYINDNWDVKSEG